MVLSRYLRGASLLLLASLVLAGLSRPARGGSPPQFHPVDIGHGYAGDVRAITSSTTGVGNVGVGPFWAVSWSEATNRVLLPAGTYDQGQATAVNAGGTIAGFTQFGAAYSAQSLPFHAVAWQNGARVRLAEPAAAINTYANSINAAGTVVGRWDTLTPGTYSNINFHAARWNPDGSLVDLALPGENASEAVCVNDAGQIAGYRADSHLHYHAIVWSADGAAQDIGDLYGRGSRAMAINSAGVVAGVSLNAADEWVPFVWDGSMHALDLLDGVSGHYVVSGINASGAIVGQAGISTPVLWWEGQAYDLRGLLDTPAGGNYGTATLTRAVAINDRNTIAVSGNTPYPFGATRPYLLNPVPEPGAMLLVAAGLPAMLLRRRQRPPCTVDALVD